MAKISGLPAVADVQSGDSLPIARAIVGGGVESKRITVEALRAALAVLLQPLIDLAAHYANDNADVDVPGGSAGSRGARLWSGVAQAAAATVSGILANVTIAGTSAVWQAPGGATAMTIGETGEVEITLATVERLKATRALLQRLNLATMAGTVEEAREVVDAIAGVVSYVAAPGGAVTEINRPDGSRFIALLEAIALKVTALTAGSLATGQVALTDAAGTVQERREWSDGPSGAAWVDSAGRAPLLLGAELIAQQRSRDAAQRTRTASAGAWLITSKRRAGGFNHDLMSRNLTTGQVVRLTSDGTDTFDFADPVIVGSWCYLTRWAGESAHRLAVPLVGPTNSFVLQRPAAQIAFYGDSFTPDGPLLADELTAAGGHTFVQLPSLPNQTRGVGGRSLTGSVASFLGGLDPGPGTVYTGNPQDGAAILLITDDHNSTGDNLSDTNAIIAKYAEFFAGQKVAERQGVLMQPGLPLGGVGGSSSRAAWNTREAAIKAAFPAFYCDVLPLMQSAIGTGYMRTRADFDAAGMTTVPPDSAARDQQYVDAGLWPASCYNQPGTDPSSVVDGHPSNTKGRALYRQAARDFIIAKGWHL